MGRVIGWVGGCVVRALPKAGQGPGQQGSLAELRTGKGIRWEIVGSGRARTALAESPVGCPEQREREIACMLRSGKASEC